MARSDDGNDDGDIVRSGEAAASDRGREQDSNRGKCLTSPAPRSLIPYDTSHRETEDDRDRAVDVEGQLQLPHERTERRECGGRSGRRTDPSLNPSLSRSSRFFTPKCDRRSRRIVCVVGEGRKGRKGRKGSHTEESNGTRLLPAARARLSAAARRKMVSSPHLQRIAHPTFLPQSIEIPFVKRSASARSPRSAFSSSRRLIALCGPPSVSFVRTSMERA